MTDKKNRREHARFGCEAVVVILREKTRMLSSVLMRNFSVGGLYFEVSAPLNSGEYIGVRTDKISIIDPVGSETRDSRPAEVKWCRKKEANGSKLYGCGAKYV